MLNSFRGFSGVCLFFMASIGLGCSGNSIDEGVPKDVGYVPPKMQPNMGTAKGKPALGATEKDKKEQAAKAKSETGAAEPPSP